MPAAFVRTTPPELPEVSEVDVIRHYSRLSQMNYGVDTHFYPLGSCTMKYNPKINEDMARLPGFLRLHPLAPVAASQGALQLMWELARDLAEISGMDQVSLQPAAGAQGEFAGVLMIRAYHLSRGERRHKVLIPDSAHGTNPATTALAGYQVVQLKSDEAGEVDLADLERNLDEDVAAFMITQPNTLGLFESKIHQITEMCHAKGVQVYMDGANFNAILGITRPGDLGFDVCHFNLHKTFTTPHGGGGPGAGPVGIKAHLVPFLPTPVVVKDDEDGYALDWSRPQSIGKLQAFWGNFGMLVRAYTYIRTMGPDGLRAVSDNAVLNANYILKRLEGDYDRATAGPVHARVRDLGAAAEEARRLRDRHRQAAPRPRLLRAHHVLPLDRGRGAHDRAHRDRVQGNARRILRRHDPDRPRGGDGTRTRSTRRPVTTPVRRLDQTLAARQPVLKWTRGQG